MLVSDRVIERDYLLVFVLWSDKPSVVMHTYIYIYKAEKPSVRPSVRLSDRHVSNSVVSPCINMGLALHDSYVFWHVQVCFKKFLSTILCSPER